MNDGLGDGERPNAAPLSGATLPAEDPGRRLPGALGIWAEVAADLGNGLATAFEQRVAAVPSDLECE